MVQSSSIIWFINAIWICRTMANNRVLGFSLGFINVIRIFRTVRVCTTSLSVAHNDGQSVELPTGQPVPLHAVQSIKHVGKSGTHSGLSGLLPPAYL
jgi:hypothetical protein